MKRSLLLSWMLVIAFFISGCPLFFDCEEPCDGGYCDDDLWSCVDNSDCWSGEYCDEGTCAATYYCDWDGWCPDGYTCDDRNSCIPDGSEEIDVDDDPVEDPVEEPERCFDDTHCENGYCAEGDEISGFCVDTGTCEVDEDCEEFGAGLACGENGICLPEEPPCPTGECGCTADSECTDGNLCIDSLCTDPEAICLFDFECSDGAMCLDNKCHATCDSECPAGQACLDGLCLEPLEGLDGCIYSEDCGANFICINATCLTTCTADDQCLEGEACQGGACRADTSPVHECSTGGLDCNAGMSCVRGACRLPCAADINCTGEMGFCGNNGFCVHADELAPECTRAADCAANTACLSNSCVMF